MYTCTNEYSKERETKLCNTYTCKCTDECKKQLHVPVAGGATYSFTSTTGGGNWEAMAAALI